MNSNDISPRIHLSRFTDDSGFLVYQAILDGMPLAPVTRNPSLAMRHINRAIDSDPSLATYNNIVPLWDGDTVEWAS